MRVDHSIQAWTRADGLAALKRVSPIILLETRMNMYDALATPYFNYCSPVWGNMGKGLSDKLLKLQNRAARIVTFSNIMRRLSDLLDEPVWERSENKRMNS